MLVEVPSSANELLDVGLGSKLLSWRWLGSKLLGWRRLGSKLLGCKLLAWVASNIPRSRGAGAGVVNVDCCSISREKVET